MGWLSNHDGRFMGRSHLVQHCTRHFPLRSPGQELQSQESSLAQLAAPMIHSDLLHCCICCTWYCLLFRHKICALHRTRIFSGNMSCHVMFCDWRFLASPRKNGPFVPQPTHPVQRWSCCWLPQTEPLPESNDEIGKTKLRSINGGSTAQTKSRWN